MTFFCKYPAAQPTPPTVARDSVGGPESGTEQYFLLFSYDFLEGTHLSFQHPLSDRCVPRHFAGIHMRITEGTSLKPAVSRLATAHEGLVAAACHA